MWTGFGRSVNTYFVPLQERVGAENVVDVAKRLGIQFRAAEGQRRSPTTSGRAPAGARSPSASPHTTPLELANAYATWPPTASTASRSRCRRSRDHDGNKLDVGQPALQAGGQPEVARAAVDAARCPVGDNVRGLGRCGGAARRRQRRAAIVGHPVAGKTGTTDSNWTADAGR